MRDFYVKLNQKNLQLCLRMLSQVISHQPSYQQNVSKPPSRRISTRLASSLVVSLLSPSLSGSITPLLWLLTRITSRETPSIFVPLWFNSLNDHKPLLLFFWLRQSGYKQRSDKDFSFSSNFKQREKSLLYIYFFNLDSFLLTIKVLQR